MSRLGLLEQFYLKRMTPMEFNFEQLRCPYRIEQLLTYTDVMDIHTIVNSVKYMGNAERRVKLIDEIMRKRNFRKYHAGTNRTVYLFLDDTSFVAKVPIDKNGELDNIAEFENQEKLKPFCTKMFQYSPFGTVSFSERVIPITNRDEFISIADDIFDLIVYKIIGKYVMDDIGSDKFMNYGVRTGFGPVILDYPKLFELDGNKLKCVAVTMDGHICNADIDYDEGFNNIICRSCGAIYKARDLSSYITEGKIKLIKTIGGEMDMNFKVVVSRGEEVVRERVFKDGEESISISNKGKQNTEEEIRSKLEPVEDQEEDVVDEEEVTETPVEDHVEEPVEEVTEEPEDIEVDEPVDEDQEESTDEEDVEETSEESDEQEEVAEDKELSMEELLNEQPVEENSKLFINEDYINNDMIDKNEDVAEPFVHNESEENDSTEVVDENDFEKDPLVNNEEEENYKNVDKRFLSKAKMYTTIPQALRDIKKTEDVLEPPIIQRRNATDVIDAY